MEHITALTVSDQTIVVTIERPAIRPSVLIIVLYALLVAAMVSLAFLLARQLCMERYNRYVRALHCQGSCLLSQNMGRVYTCWQICGPIPYRKATLQRALLLARELCCVANVGVNVV